MMPLASIIMFIVAAIFSAVGTGLLLALARPRTQGQVYAFRIIGIMALSGGVVLAMSATAMWRWSVEG